MNTRWALLAAAAALGALAAEAPFEFFVVPATPQSARNTEADILPLRDGRLMLAWTEFYSSEGSDWGPSRIAALFSRDHGRTWNGRRVLQENIGKMNVMEADLLRLESGKVLFIFAKKNSEADCVPMVRISSDDAATFSQPRPMAIEPNPSYTGFNHDRAIQLASGRILLPVFFTPDWRREKRVRSRVYYSDDEGADWKAGPVIDVPSSRVGADEPGVVELKDGRVMLWIRTSTGHPWRAFSKDGGATWSEPEAMPLTAPNSPMSIKRIPKTGDLLAVWNDSPRHRFPLTSAISSDEGNTWTHQRDLDADPAHTYSYTSIAFDGDRVLFTYYAGGAVGAHGPDGGLSLKLKSVPVSWLYGSSPANAIH